MKRLLWILLVLLLSLTPLWTVGTLLASPNASTSWGTQSSIVATLEDPPPLAVPCGAGTQLPFWVICLHGMVALQEPSGALIPLAGVPMTVTFAGQHVTGTTAVSPISPDPIYALDLSPLEPLFLQPITITAVVNNIPIQHQIVLFPDFRTQSQQFDLIIPTTGALDRGQFWGYVVDFAVGQPVTNAIVTAELPYGNMTVTTSVSAIDGLPIYTLDTNVPPGTLLTLTASYNGDQERQVVTVPDRESTQLNFVTGWKCDDFDPLPRTGSGDGLPRTGSGDGLPDVACFWGYGLIDGMPLPGMTIQLVISGTVYEAETKLYAGESIPRYGIGLGGGSVVSGTEVVATAVYAGQSKTEFLTVTLDAAHSQQIDLAVTAAGVLENFTNANYVNTVKAHNGYVWSGTTGGVVRWNPTNDSYQKFTTLDGLLDNNVTAIYPIADGSIWFRTDDGMSHYRPDRTPIWENYPGLDIVDLTTSADGNIWFVSTGSFDTRGFYYYTPTTQTVLQFIPDAPFDFPVNTISYDAIENSIWLGTNNGVSRYFITTGSWATYTVSSTNGLLTDNQIHKIVADATGDVWLGTENGVSRYAPTSQTWMSYTYTNTEGALIDFPITAMAATSDGSMWFASRNGAKALTYLSPANVWQTMTATGQQWYDISALIVGADNSVWSLPARTGRTLMRCESGESASCIRQVNSTPNHACYGTSRRMSSLTLSADGHVWYGISDGDGLCSFNPHDGSVWKNLTLPGPWANYINYLALSPDGSLWYRGSFRGRGRLGHYIADDPNAWPWIEWGERSRDPGVMSTDQDSTLWFYESYSNGQFQQVVHYTPNNPDQTTIYTTENTNGGLVSGRIGAIDVAPDGSIWFGSGYVGTGVSRYNPRDTPNWITYTVENTNGGLIDNSISDIVVAADGTVYFTYGSPSGGMQRRLSRYFPETDQWEELYPPGSSGSVGNIAFGQDGSIWLGRSGARRYRPDGVWEMYDETDGLADNSVATIAVGQDGSLWFGHGYPNVGLTHFSPETGQWRIYTTADGLADNSINDIVVAPNGNLWIATANGLTYWNTEATDLSVTVEGPEFALPGQVITYAVALVNQGQAAAVNSVVTFTLPAGVTYLDSSLPPTSTTPLVWQANIFLPQDVFTTVVTASVSPETVPGSNLTAVVEANTSSKDEFENNNTAVVKTFVRDPDRADLQLALQGPLHLTPGSEQAYIAQIENIGGLTGQNNFFSLAFDPKLSFATASPPPDSVNPPTWQWDELPPTTFPLSVVFTVTVADTAVLGEMLSVTGSITTTTPDSNPTNNQATATVHTSLADAQTLFLVASARGNTAVLDKLYTVAAHPQVNGVILDVLRDTQVAQAYNQWDAAPANQHRANHVARTIKALIDDITITYPNLRYIVVVGGDEIIPFYRVPDQNPTVWTERRYARMGGLPHGTVRMALRANMLLTDDFYAAREATVPDSPFWYDGHELYLPDFAIGRLVETPTEITAALNAFLQHNGRMTLNNALVGTFRPLTHDLGQAQCHTLTADGIAAACTNSPNQFRAETLNNSYDTIWSAFHSNHDNMGRLSAHDILNRAASYSGTLFTSIGCHAGLNVAGSGRYNGLDSAQAILGQQGVFIAPLNYAYASRFGIGYAEALSDVLLQQLVMTNTQTLGTSLVQAKHHYYADHAGWFDYLDEKTVLPLVLYGLPMWQVETPDAVQVQKQSEPTHQMTTTQLNEWDVLTVSLNGLTFTEHITDSGHYFDYQGQVWAQEGWPLQPQAQISLPADINGRVPRSLLLDSATYTVISDFNPLVSQSWALSEPALFSNPTPAFTGWDREWPYALGHFQGLHNAVVSLNFAFGRYHAELAQEQLFEALAVQVIYSDHADTTPPQISAVAGYDVAGQTHIQVQANDDTAVAQVVGICDTSVGAWESVTLTQTEGAWHGSCPNPTAQFFVQVLDIGGNLTTSEWQSASAYDLAFAVAPHEQGGLPGQTVTYTLEVTNQSVSTAVLQLTLPDTISWPVVLANDVITAVGNTTTQAHLAVTLPDTALGDAQTILPITATLADCPLCWSMTHEMTTTVLPTHGLQLSAPITQHGNLPSETLTYTVILENLGNVSETVVWSITNTAVWLIPLPPTTTLLPHQTIELPITVTIPLTAPHDSTNNLTITATLENQPAISASVQATASVSTLPPIYDLNLTVPISHQVGLPGESLVYTATLINLGNMPDTIIWSTTDTANWLISPPPVTTLLPDQTVDLLITVKIPLTAPHDSTNHLTITATLENQPSVSASVHVTATVSTLPPIYDLELTVPISHQAGLPGESLVYTATLTNFGNMPDTIIWSTTNTANWLINNPAPLTVLPQQMITVPITATVPLTATADSLNSITITATSQNEPSTSRQALVIASIFIVPIDNNYIIYLPIIERYE